MKQVSPWLARVEDSIPFVGLTVGVLWVLARYTSVISDQWVEDLRGVLHILTALLIGVWIGRKSANRESFPVGRKVMPIEGKEKS